MNNWCGRILMLAASAAILPACGDGGNSSSNSQAKSTYSDPDIEVLPDEGHEHVAPGTPITYKSDPPTSGPHYEEFVAFGGFYSKEIDPPWVVHSMEHGGVIIYFSPAVTKQQRDQLKKLADQHPGKYAQVVVEPRDDAAYPIILTAWTHRLRLAAFDSDRIDGFLTLFLDQGLEHAGDDP